MKYPEILAINPPPAVFAYDDAYTMGYALAVGCGGEPDELSFVYERILVALPTMAVTMAPGIGDFITQGGLEFRKILHGEQRLTIHQPLPPTGEMMTQARCLSVIDKGPDKGALLNIECTVAGKDGTLHATMISTLFCRGDGGFGGPGTGELTLPAPPDRPHDLAIALPILPQQAALYRMLGDRNPLHIDPAAAASVGFAGPILHGLCTYAIAARAILKGCCDNDPQRIARFDARFASPVYPGETLVTYIWRDGDEIAFECRVAERNAVIIRNGFCRLRA